MSIKEQEQEIEDICYSSNYSGLEKEKKLKRLIKKTKEQDKRLMRAIFKEEEDFWNDSHLRTEHLIHKRLVLGLLKDLRSRFEKGKTLSENSKKD